MALLRREYESNWYENQWRLLTDEEHDTVWAQVHKAFAFTPSNKVINQFQFHNPVDVYDISQSQIWQDREDLNEIVRQGFVACIGAEPGIYALDWHHDCFLYNPRVRADITYPVYMADDTPFGGSNVYFLTYYPDGDYYFFYRP